MQDLRPAVNRALLDERLFSDVDLLRQIASLAVAEIQRIGSEIEVAVLDGDVRALATLAHELKGLFGNVSADGGWALAEALYQEAKSGSVTALGGPLSALQAEAKRVRSELEPICGGGDR